MIPEFYWRDNMLFLKQKKNQPNPANENEM